MHLQLVLALLAQYEEWENAFLQSIVTASETWIQYYNILFLHRQTEKVENTAKVLNMY